MQVQFIMGDRTKSSAKNDVEKKIFCMRNGCSKEYVGVLSNVLDCTHHPGIPVVDDNNMTVAYMCCDPNGTKSGNKKGCKTGKHLFSHDLISKKNGAPGKGKSPLKRARNSEGNDVEREKAPRLNDSKGKKTLDPHTTHSKGRKPNAMPVSSKNKERGVDEIVNELWMKKDKTGVMRDRVAEEKFNEVLERRIEEFFLQAGHADEYVSVGSYLEWRRKAEPKLLAYLKANNLPEMESVTSEELEFFVRGMCAGGLGERLFNKYIADKSHNSDRNVQNPSSLPKNTYCPVKNSPKNIPPRPHLDIREEKVKNLYFMTHTCWEMYNDLQNDTDGDEYIERLKQCGKHLRGAAKMFSVEPSTGNTPVTPETHQWAVKTANVLQEITTKTRQAAQHPGGQSTSSQQPNAMQAGSWGAALYDQQVNTQQQKLGNWMPPHSQMMMNPYWNQYYQPSAGYSFDPQSAWRSYMGVPQPWTTQNNQSAMTAEVSTKPTQTTAMSSSAANAATSDATVDGSKQIKK